MKTKLLFLIMCVLFWVCSTAQDITFNSFGSLDNVADTNQIVWGFGWGRINLLQPEAPKIGEIYLKKAHQEFPKRVGVGNLVMDFRTRFARDTVSGVGHDALASLNISLLRSRFFVGYQYNRPTWFATGKFGYEVYRVIGGEFKSGSKTFSRNIPLVGFEFGLTPSLWKDFFRLRGIVEYDFGYFGWYGSGTATVKALSFSFGRLDVGCQYDGIWGYGYFSSFTHERILLYASTFSGQLPIQETRFPEQRIGIDKGFALGLRVNIK